MSEKKLPKGVQSLGEIATKRGKGGQLLRRERTAVPSLETKTTPRGERHLTRQAQLGEKISSAEHEQFTKMAETHAAKVEEDLAKPARRYTPKLKLQTRLEAPTAEAVRLIGDEPSPEQLKHQRKVERARLAGTLRRGAPGRLKTGLWTGKAIETLKLASKAGKLLGIAGLPFQAMEYKELMEAPKKEREAAALRLARKT
jgi:hypothetical protein